MEQAKRGPARHRGALSAHLVGQHVAERRQPRDQEQAAGDGERGADWHQVLPTAPRPRALARLVADRAPPRVDGRVDQRQRDDGRAQRVKPHGGSTEHHVGGGVAHAALPQPEKKGQRGTERERDGRRVRPHDSAVVDQRRRERGEPGKQAGHAQPEAAGESEGSEGQKQRGGPEDGRALRDLAEPRTVIEQETKPRGQRQAGIGLPVRREQGADRLGERRARRMELVSLQHPRAEAVGAQHHPHEQRRQQRDDEQTRRPTASDRVRRHPGTVAVVGGHRG